MKRLRFGIRSILILATIVAIFMFIMLERRRYFREHVFITVLDSSSGIQLNQFQYRTWVITQASPPWPEWSVWKTFQGDKPFAFKLPAYCKLHFEAKASGLPGRFGGASTTLLVVPDASHDLTLRIANATLMTGSVIDDETNEPIEGVVVGPANEVTMESIPTDWVTDSKGRFKIATTSPITEIFAYHPRYQYRFATSDESQPLRLRKGKSVRGRVVQSQTDQPVSDCSVEVWYANGVPLRQDERPAAHDEVDDGTSARLRNVSPPRTTKTNTNGEFELFLEPLSMNTQILFRKPGWDDSFAFANSRGLSRIELKHGKYEFSGQLVDDQGKPIQRFRVRTVIDIGGWWETLAHRENEFNTTDGQFRVSSEDALRELSILADGYAPIYFRSKKQNSRRLDSRDLKLIQMSRGYRVSGSIERSKLHTKKTEVFLTDLRNGDSILVAGPPTFLANHFENDKIEKTALKGTRAFNRYQYESQVDSEGRFTFRHLAPGVYAMLVVYNDQTAFLCPVVVEGKDVELPKIELPLLGDANGTVRESNNEPSSAPSVSPLETSQVNPFGVYYLKRNGELWGKPFRVNHRGQFALDHILTGSAEICDKKYGLSDGWKEFFSGDAEIESKVVNFPFDVPFGMDARVSTGSTILCELEVEELGENAINFWLARSRIATGELGGGLCNERASLHGPRESKAWIVHAKERSLSGMHIYEVRGPADLPSGRYTLKLKDAGSSLVLDLEFQRDRRPARKSLSDHRVTVNKEVAQSSSGGLDATLVRDGQEIANIGGLSFGWGRCLVEDKHSSYKVLFHDEGKGWALMEDVSFSNQSVDFAAIDLKTGARLDVNISLQGLEIFPSELSVRHETTGKVFSQTIVATGHLDTSYSFEHLMPGKWSVEVTGRDPIVGKRRLFQQEIVIEGTKPVYLEFRKSE
jgi:hypothetical protein